MPPDSPHVFTKLVDEPFFIDCRRNLIDESSTQMATITTVDAVRLERRTSLDPEQWEVAVDTDGFSNLQVLDHGGLTDSVVAGTLDADPDGSPPPGEDYMLVAECSIQFTVDYGGGSSSRVFRRRARIPASALTAPSS